MVFRFFRFALYYFLFSGQLVPLPPLASPSLYQAVEDISVLLHLNLSALHLRQGRGDKCECHAEEARRLHPKHPKACFREKLLGFLPV